ncbi:hypothetical protein, partial [Tenacibaculum ovolyticum]|uniref:hypothetical protein n=1 Tax=Tenacibaculum ovolyticum TaxID=104270 RepID=UPI000A7F33AB
GREQRISLLHKDKSINTFPIIHQPQKLVALLKNFSKNSSVLKYTTHSWDAGRDSGLFKDIDTFLEKSEKEYKQFSFQLKELNKNLNAKIYSFLFRKDIELKGWGVNRIRFGWSSSKIQKDCESNLKLNPEDVILPEQSQMIISGKLIQKFKHVIEVFKDEIEIRDENSGLLNLILEKHDTHLIDFKNPILENLENKTFYTDVQWLSKALDLIFLNIKSRSDFLQMSYKVKETKAGIFKLEILHHNSFNKGMSIQDKKLKLDTGTFGDISNYLKNLCDWSIESKFQEGEFRINYLISESNIETFESINECKGFKHILTFYS